MRTMIDPVGRIEGHRGAPMDTFTAQSLERWGQLLATIAPEIDWYKATCGGAVGLMV